MYYEEQWRDGWLWYRGSLDGPWAKASEQEMLARMRNALELVVEATDCPKHRRATWRGCVAPCWPRAAPR